MKAPLHSILYVLIFTFIAVGTVYFFNGFDFGTTTPATKKKNPNRRPGSLRAMDAWTDMRAYPYKEMRAATYSRAYHAGKGKGLMQTNQRFGILSPTTADWVALAPKNFSGRILSIGFHPTDPNIMWVGSASGGLWKTTNGGHGESNGINWHYIPTGFPVLGVSSIAVNPNKPDTMYIGTGEVYNSNGGPTGTMGAGHIRTFRGSYGIGILRTRDGGNNWEKVLDFEDDNLKGVMDLAIHPTNPDTIFAATTEGLYRTFDGGSDWDLIHSVPLTMDLCFKPGNPEVLYFGSGNFGSANSGIYKTIDASAPSPTFTKLTTGLPSTISGKVQLTISVNNPSKIYASIGRNPNVSGDPTGLYYSTDEGDNWTATSYTGVSSKVTTQGWYAHDVAAHPGNANTVLWGELDTWRSTNGGSSFSQVGFWNNWNVNNTTIGTLMEGNNDNYVHADIHRIAFSPHDATGNTVFILTDGGVFRSTDGGQNFQTLNGGLLTAQIYSNMAISATDPNFMIGGLQDNEGFVYAGAAGCRRIPSLGDGFHCAINPRDDDTCYISGYYFNLKISTNRGSSFSSPSPAVYLGNPPSETAAFNTPFVVAPSNPNIMYAGTYRVKKSTNRGATWSNISSALFNSSCAIIYLGVAPSNADVLYVSVSPNGANRSKILKTTNGGTSFTDITGSLPDRYYSDIVVDPTDPNRVAVTLSGFGTSHVYMSHNGGTSWSNLGTGLEDVPHNTLMFDPNDRSTLYVGNDLGVFYANNVPTGALGATTSLTWISYNEGFDDANMVSDILVTSSNKLRIATYGRGLWERDLAPNSSMPVVMTHFDAVADIAGNRLSWTVTETNVERYEIEYSTNGTQFSKVASLRARGGNGEMTYEYYHYVSNLNDGYYRIRIVDIDGSYSFSSIEMVQAFKVVTKMRVYPNPNNGVFSVRLPASEVGDIKVVIYDNAGRLVFLKKLTYQGGDIPVDIQSASAGNYKIIVEGKKSRAIGNVIKR